MADNAMLSLKDYKSRIADEHPAFGQALLEEEGHRKLCRRVREDLRALRDSLDLKQSDLANRLGMSQSVISRIENGEGDIGLLTISRYAATLGLQTSVNFVPRPSAYMNAAQAQHMSRAMEQLSSVQAKRVDSALAPTSETPGTDGRGASSAPSPTALPDHVVEALAAATTSIWQHVYVDLARMISAVARADAANAGTTAGVSARSTHANAP